MTGLLPGPFGDAQSTGRLIESVRQVGSPLGFFARGLLFLYLFLIAAGTLFGLPESVKIWIVVIGVLGFVALAVAVVWLTAGHAPDLVFGEVSQLRYREMLFGTKEHPVPASVARELPAIQADVSRLPQPELPPPPEEREA